jgi:hypothetical protein
MAAMKNKLLLSCLGLVMIAVLYIEDEKSQQAFGDYTFGDDHQQLIDNIERDGGDGGSLAFFNTERSDMLDGDMSNASRPTMTIVPCRVAGERTLTHAFMLPPGWQANCQTSYYRVMNLLNYKAEFSASKPGSGIQLTRGNLERYFYSPQRLQIIRKIMDMSGGWSNPEQVKHFRDTQRLVQPVPQNIPEYIQARAAAQLQQRGYKLYHLSKDPLLTNYRKLVTRNIPPQMRQNVGVDLLTAIGEDHSGNISLIKYILYVFKLPGSTNWQLDEFMANGPKPKASEMSDLINLQLMTYQENAKHSLTVNSINQKFLRDQLRAMREIHAKRMETHREISNMIDEGYRRRNSINEKGHSKIVDSIWEVETFRNPVDGSIIKAPMHNRFYFTNNMDDYIGTNNPLLNGELGLTTLYNWTKLERIN